MAEAINAIFTFFTTILKWCLDGVMWLLSKVLFLAFDGLLTTVQAFFSAIDISSFVASYALSWTGLPDQFIWFVNAVSLPQGVSILTGAIIIRMAINLIPAEFTRL